MRLPLRQSQTVKAGAATPGVVDTTWWLVALGLGVGWLAMLRRWEANGQLDRWNATRALGFILMVRTRRGQVTLEAISRPRRFWRIIGEIGLWTCRGTMGIVILVLLATLVLAFTTPPADDPPAPLTLVGVPGINPIIPFGWGIVAFVIALVIHELGHGIQARAHGMRVRSFGLLLLGPLPLGAFAEPEYDELMRAPRRERQRMFAAGPATNIYASLGAFVILAMLASQLVAATPGVHATQIVVDSPAQQSGLQPYESITMVDDDPVSTPAGLIDRLDDEGAGETVRLTIHNHTTGEARTTDLVLADQHAWLLANEDVSREELDRAGIEPGDAFLGVGGLSSGTAGVDRLAGPLGRAWSDDPLLRGIGMIIHPLMLLRVPLDQQGAAVVTYEIDMLEAGDGAVASLLGVGGLLFLIQLMFWLVWVNILLGFTNLIPMVPFDGGHMFRDRMHDWLSRLDRVGRRINLWRWHPMRIERLVQRASGFISLGVLMVVLLSMVSLYIPR